MSPGAYGMPMLPTPMSPNYMMNPFLLAGPASPLYHQVMNLAAKMEGMPVAQGMRANPLAQVGTSSARVYLV